MQTTLNIARKMHSSLPHQSQYLVASASLKLLMNSSFLLSFSHIFRRFSASISLLLSFPISSLGLFPLSSLDLCPYLIFYSLHTSLSNIHPTSHNLFRPRPLIQSSPTFWSIHPRLLSSCTRLQQVRSLLSALRLSFGSFLATPSIDLVFHPCTTLERLLFFTLHHLHNHLKYSTLTLLQYEQSAPPRSQILRQYGAPSIWFPSASRPKTSTEIHW